MAQTPGEQPPAGGNAARNEGQTRRLAEEAARAGRGLADGASEAGRSAAAAGAEVLRGGVEATGDAVQAGLKSAETALQGMVDTVNRTFGLGDPRTEELVRRSADHVRTVREATTVLTQGAQQVSHTWIEVAQDGSRASVEAVNRLAACRSAPDLIALQCELWREGVQRSLTGSQSIARATLSAMEEAGRRIQPTPPAEARPH